LRYFDSPFDLRFEELVRSRRALLDRDSVLYRNALVEPQPPYAGSGQDERSAVASVLSGHTGRSSNAIADLADFAELGSFPLRGAMRTELYMHQVEMVRTSSQRSEDAVIVTGTGSGKTEAIYLPILAALVHESLRWPALPARPRNDWWAMPPPTGSGRRRYHP